MNKLAYSVLIAILVGGVTLAGFDLYRESHALKSTGLGLSWWSVSLTYVEERSINLGADSTTIYEFALPADFDGISKCGSEGYTEVRIVPVRNLLVLPGLGSISEEGCIRRTINDHGTTYVHVLLDDRAYVKIM